MALEFFAESPPFKGLPSQTHTLDPANPFYTAAYVEARRLMGSQPWVIGIRQNGNFYAGSTAFLTIGRLSSRIDIPSLCGSLAVNEFWEGLLQMCRNLGVWELEINSFASQGLALPKLPGELRRFARCEYVLDLPDANLWNNLSHGGKYSVKRALKAGIQLHQTIDPSACLHHIFLRSDSMQRRMNRGEKVSSAIDTRTAEAYLATGSGILFQALCDREVLSSYLVMMAPKGAYLHSGGTSSEGMRLGASQFLIHKVSLLLQSSSFDRFYLGGADPENQGLVKFKTSFGSYPVNLEASLCFAKGWVARGCAIAVRTLTRLAGI